MNQIRLKFWVASFVCFAAYASNAQIYAKMEYNRVADYRSPWFYAAGFSLLNFDDDDYLRNHLFKVYGEDSLNNEENTFEIEHTADSIRLWDIEYISFDSDSEVRVHGTWYLISYQLTEEEKNKRIITRLNNNGEYAIMNVYSDNSGKKYIKLWHRGSDVVLKDQSISKITVTNRSRWFKTERQKNKFINQYYTAKGVLWTSYAITAVTTATVGLIYVLSRAR